MVNATATSVRQLNERALVVKSGTRNQKHLRCRCAGAQWGSAPCISPISLHLLWLAKPDSVTLVQSAPLAHANFVSNSRSRSGPSVSADDDASGLVDETAPSAQRIYLQGLQIPQCGSYPLEHNYLASSYCHELQMSRAVAVKILA